MYIDIPNIQNDFRGLWKTYVVIILQHRVTRTQDFKNACLEQLFGCLEYPDSYDCDKLITREQSNYEDGHYCAPLHLRL